MLFWKEIYMTWDMEVCYAVRETLAKEEIPSRTVSQSIAHSGRGHGVPFINASAAYPYKILVKRKDYGKAKRVLDLK